MMDGSSRIRCRLSRKHAQPAKGRFFLMNKFPPAGPVAAQDLVVASPRHKYAVQEFRAVGPQKRQARGACERKRVDDGFEHLPPRRGQSQASERCGWLLDAHSIAGEVGIELNRRLS